MDQGCDQEGCSLTRGTTNHPCSFDDNNCSQPGCDSVQAHCSDYYATTNWTCSGSYQASTGSCSGDGIQTTGDCTGNPTTSGICTGTIIMPTSTPVPTAAPTPEPNPTTEPDSTPTPTPFEIPEDCNILPGETACPSGTIRDDSCHDSCSDNNVICCKDIDEDQQCTRSDRECSQDNSQYRYCIVNDAQGTSGIWSSWRTCPENYNCLQGVCVQHTPTPEPTQEPEIAANQCNQGERECSDDDSQYRYCIYNSSVEGVWSGWRTCPENYNCQQGVCIKQTPTSTPTPTQAPTSTPAPTLAPLASDCQLLTDTQSCPSGTIRDDSCHQACLDSNVLCCKELEDDQEECERGQKECVSENSSRYCIVPDGNSQTGYWSQPVSCSAGASCAEAAGGICVYPTSTPTAQQEVSPTPEFGGECSEGERECCQAGQEGCTENQFRTCIYDERAGFAGVWSVWKSCADHQTCQNGSCTGSYVPPSPTPQSGTAGKSLFSAYSTPTPTQSAAPYQAGGNCLWGERSCPDGMQPSTNCGSECRSPYAVCCEAEDELDRCTSGERA